MQDLDGSAKSIRERRSPFAYQAAQCQAFPEDPAGEAESDIPIGEEAA
jgi:hypothetical protein